MWHPFSNKLKLMSKEEVELKRRMVEGILSLQAGDSPVAIEAKFWCSCLQPVANPSKNPEKEAEFI